MLIESDKSRRMLTTFTVDPERDGRSRVRIQTRWYTDGLAGIVQRLVAPRMLAKVYRQELELLNRYAGGQTEVVTVRYARAPDALGFRPLIPLRRARRRRLALPAIREPGTDP